MVLYAFESIGIMPAIQLLRVNKTFQTRKEKTKTNKRRKKSICRQRTEEGVVHCWLGPLTQHHLPIRRRTTHPDVDQPCHTLQQPKRPSGIDSSCPLSVVSLSHLTVMSREKVLAHRPRSLPFASDDPAHHPSKIVL